MKTALDLAKRSLTLLLAESPESPLEADEYQDYYDALNAFMDDLKVNGIDLGYQEVTNGADLVVVPRGAIRGIVANVAIDVAADYGGKVTAPLVKMADSGMTTLYRLGRKRIKTSLHGNLPRGTGSEDYPEMRNTYYDRNVAGFLTLAGNTLPTEFSAISTPVLVVGEWDTQGFGSLAPTVAGRLTNTSGRPAQLEVDITVTATSPAAASATVTLMRNGAEAVATALMTLSATRTSALLAASLRLQPGEYLELFVENGTDTGDITIADAIIETS